MKCAHSLAVDVKVMRDFVLYFLDDERACARVCVHYFDHVMRVQDMLEERIAMRGLRELPERFHEEFARLFGDIVALNRRHVFGNNEIDCIIMLHRGILFGSSKPVDDLRDNAMRVHEFVRCLRDDIRAFGDVRNPKVNERVVRIHGYQKTRNEILRIGNR